MQVSDVRLALLDTDNAVKAIGSIALDGVFAVRGVRVMEDKNGHNFVAFPSRKKSDGSYEDLAFPTTKELYAHITGAVLEEFQNQVKKQEQEQKDRKLEKALLDASAEQIQTEDASEAKPAPKRGKGR